MKTIVLSFNILIIEWGADKIPTLLRSMEILTNNIKSPHSIYVKQQAPSAQIIYVLLAVKSLRNHFHQRQGLATV